MTILGRRFLILIGLLLGVGLAIGRLHQPSYNLENVAPVDRPDRPSAYTNRSVSSDPRDRPNEDTFIWVAFSGGGTRAAAMAWKTLEELRKIPMLVARDGELSESNLADEIDYISGISGGCFAAAGWPLFRDHPETFRQKFLEENIERRLIYEIVTPPWRLFTLASSEYDRINVAAEFYDRVIFNETTFGDLPPRPALRVHATNVAMGTRFSFSQDDFDQIGSDLRKYPLGYACAASSAFPILLSPLALKNHGETKEIDNLRKSDRLFRKYENDSKKSVLADLNRLERIHYNDKSNAYVHLADGGIVDNQGLDSLLLEFESGRVISRRLNDSSHPLKRLVLINVNAGVTPDNGLAKSATAPGITKVVEHTMVASMDILSAKRWMSIKRMTQDIYKPVIDGANLPAFRQLEKPFTIEISFRNVKNRELMRDIYDIPTSFALNTSQLKLIDQAVPQLIAENLEMQRLKVSLESDRR